MKLFVAAFKRAITLGVFLHILVYSVGSIADFDYREVLALLPASILMFVGIPFVVLYLSFKHPFSQLLGLKIGIGSFAFGLLLSVLFNGIDADSFVFESVHLGTGLGALLLALMVYASQWISQGSDSIELREIGAVKYRVKYVLAIAIAVSGLYSLFTLVFAESSVLLLPIWYELFPLGFTLSFATIHVLTYSYVRFSGWKRPLVLGGYYLVVTFAIVTMLIITRSSFAIVKGGLGGALAKAFILPTTLYYAVYLTLVFLGTHGYFVLLVRSRQQVLLAKDRADYKEGYDELKQQLSPHFLFNNLNVLTGLIEEDPGKAVAFSDQLAAVYRYYLLLENNDLMTVKEEVAFFYQYFSLLEQRFEACFVLDNKLDASFDNYYVVSLALQQITENICKHNSLNRTLPIQVTLEIAERYLVVRNSKQEKAYDEKHQNGTGLKNIEERYRFFTDKAVKITDTETTFEVAIPLLEIDD